MTNRTVSANDNEELLEEVSRLADEVVVLRQCLDRVTDIFTWAVNNGAINFTELQQDTIARTTSSSSAKTHDTPLPSQVAATPPSPPPQIPGGLF